MKFELEKVLHEIIRDLPEAAKVNESFRRGFSTNMNAFQRIADIIREEQEKAAFADIPVIDTTTGETVNTNAAEILQNMQK